MQDVLIYQILAALFFSLWAYTIFRGFQKQMRLRGCLQYMSDCFSEYATEVDEFLQALIDEGTLDDRGDIYDHIAFGPKRWEFHLKQVYRICPTFPMTLGRFNAWQVSVWDELGPKPYPFESYSGFADFELWENQVKRASKSE